MLVAPDGTYKGLSISNFGNLGLLAGDRLTVVNTFTAYADPATIGSFALDSQADANLIKLAGGALPDFAISQVADSSAVLSAADGSALTAHESIASFYGPNLAGSTAEATTVPLPTELATVSLEVIDSAGTKANAPLFYVSSNQINFEIPPGLVSGYITFNVMRGGSIVASATANVQMIAPALFTANQSGTGVAAAYVIQGQSQQLLTSSCGSTGCSSVPISLDASTPTFLSLFGTGIRNRTALENVTATIAGTPVPVLYAGPQGIDVGLDQVNLQLPVSLQGTGETDLVLTVDGRPANTVRINIQ
jgi:uncharacterized protein (TIGR03437 family)